MERKLDRKSIIGIGVLIVALLIGLGSVSIHDHLFDQTEDEVTITILPEQTIELPSGEIITAEKIKCFFITTPIISCSIQCLS